MGSDQPRPTVATGHTEQGALLTRWQPIETAPKDGTRFMAYEEADEAKFYPCWWQEDFGYWEGWQNVWDSEPNPTHWMPLPPPPA